ncbi:MAG TPA: BON domain-containing protein [Steroidobacteraceae bacterium]|jgi:osmotically-inducible protein OsmY
MRFKTAVPMLLLTITLAPTLSACATYRKCGLRGCPGDAQITTKVETAFDQYPVLGGPNIIRVQTLDRVVYLNGLVATDLQRDMAADVAAHAADGAKIINSIAVTNVGR